jgi:hypothetical protein
VERSEVGADPDETSNLITLLPGVDNPLGTAQLMRYVPLVRRIASQVTVWAQPSLLPLLKGDVLSLHDGAPDCEYDVDVEVMELAHVFRATEETIPKEVPYIHVTPVRSWLQSRRMAGYSGTPLAKKLGINAGCKLFADGASANYASLLAPLPDDVTFVKKLTSSVDETWSR